MAACHAMKVVPHATARLSMVARNAARAKSYCLMAHAGRCVLTRILDNMSLMKVLACSARRIVALVTALLPIAPHARTLLICF